MSPRETACARPPALERVAELEAVLGSAVRGKAEAVRLALVCLFAKGHLLVEDVPGVGKTTLAQALARAVNSTFHRLQFTADMLPSDVLGVTVYNARTGAFEFKQGPIFTNFLLADEINRTPPKTQSALLEAMNERQVTVDGRSYPLAEPFMVIATQNPIEHHGTYPLPESQLDRFLMRIRIGYPDAASEREIVRRAGQMPALEIRPVLTAEEVVQIQSWVPQVRVDEALVDYMLAVVEKTRTHESITLGVSPRGAQALYRATQALAMLEGRDYALPDDVKRLVIPVFAHRIVVNTRLMVAHRSADLNDRILAELLTLVEVPL
ncbi:MAG: MoxR family ATPase [Bryobacterales bacterium]|nr:MoxR family ATPase [Bryobacteraceae bacterium]MDW8130358.1 MoxR family ATPase [Bryobacterales bacterium]